MHCKVQAYAQVFQRDALRGTCSPGKRFFSTFNRPWEHEAAFDIPFGCESSSVVQSAVLEVTPAPRPAEPAVLRLATTAGNHIACASRYQTDIYDDFNSLNDSVTHGLQ